MKALRLLATIALLCAAWGAQAQARLTDKEDQIDLWPHARVLIDASRTVTFGRPAAG